MATEGARQKDAFPFIKNSGGLNTYSSRFDRSPTQCLQNTNCVYTKSGAFTNRGGQAIVSTAPSGSPESLYSLEFSRTLSGVTTRKKIEFTADGKVYDITGGAPVQILAGLTAGSIPDVIVTRGWLCFVNGVDTPQKWNGTTWYNWGIIAPASAPNLAAGAAGNPNGTYRFRVAYRRNPIDALDPGSVSSMGTISSLITVVSTIINLTNIPLSADPQVDARDLFVEIGGQWYLFQTINDNVTTTASYNLLDSQAVLGEVGRTDRDPPTSDLKVIENHGNVVYGSNGITLAWSILDEFESFDQLARLSNAFDAGDGFLITGLRSMTDLVVSKQRSMYLRSGDDVSYTITKKVFDSGVIARNSMVVKDTMLYYFAHDGFRVFDGNTSALIDVNIHDLIFGTTTEKIVYTNRMSQVSGVYYSRENISAILWAVPSAVTENKLMLGYFTKYFTTDSQNQQVNVWAIWDNLNARFVFKAVDPNSLFDRLYTTGMNGELRSVDSGFNDLGAKIDCSYLQTDQFFNDAFAKKRLRDAYFAVSVDEGPAPTGTYQVEWYVDGQATGVIKTLQFMGNWSVFDIAKFDIDHFAPEGNFWAVTGYTSDPFYTICPRVFWSVSSAEEVVLWNGWVLRIIPAGYRRDSHTQT